MIDLTKVREIVDEATALIDELDGFELDETNAVKSQAKSSIRTLKAKKSQNLQLLATRLELAAQLVRVEYWYARGEADPIRTARND